VTPQTQRPSIARSTALNVLGSAVPLALALVTIPLYLRVIGDARYGVLAAVWVLLGYFGLFDLGMGRAVANGVAKRTQSAPDQIGSFVWTAGAVALVLGIVGGAILAITGGMLIGLLKMPAELRSEALPATIFFALAVPGLTVSSVFQGALEGQERFWEANLVTSFGATVLQGLPLIAALIFGPSLMNLLAATALARITGAILAITLCNNWIGRMQFNSSFLPELWRYGGWISVTSIVGPLMTVFDQLLIGSRLGATALAHYNIPFNIVVRVQVVPTAINRALFPRLAGVEQVEGHRLATDAIAVIAAVTTVLVVTGLICIDPFLNLWLGPKVAQDAAPVGEVLLVGLWFNCLAFVPYTLLQARGRPDVPARFHLIELVPYLAALWIGLTLFGLIGAAVVWSFRTLADALLLFHASSLLSEVIRLTAFGLLLMLITASGALLWWPSIAVRGVAGIALLVISCFWAWRVSPAPLRFTLTRMWTSRFQPKAVLPDA
jgi:O-antigen/teichoic acid export membrane protein